MLWIHQQLDGRRLQELSTSKRVQLATSCWHVAIEHHQSIVILVAEGQHGSALALIRPAFEAYIRGLWLMHAASDEAVDRAGRDDFPNDVNQLLREVEASGHLTRGALRSIKNSAWKRLCSLTHTGFRQIGARLTAEGLGSRYERAELLQALSWANTLGLLSAEAFAYLLQDERMGREALDRLRSGIFLEEQS